LGLRIIGTNPANRERGCREVTRKRSLGLLPSNKLQSSAEGKDLESTGNRDREGGIPTGAKVGKLGSVGRDVTREVDSGLVDKVSNNTKHADTSVLDLDSSKAIELLLVAISDKAKRIEKPERRLGSKLVLEAHLQGRGAAGALGRSKGGGASNEGGKSSSLHDDVGLLTTTKL
jgi:hypothetical protein